MRFFPRSIGVWVRVRGMVNNIGIGPEQAWKKYRVRDANANPNSYLFIDMKPTTPDAYRLKSHVLDSLQVLYVPK